MKLNKMLVSLFSILILPLFFISCNSNTNKLESIKQSGKITLGTSADYPPYEFPFIDENGNEQIVGFDIEIAKEIAKDLGVELVIKNLDFSGLLDALNSNNVDFILSGISPTEERKQSIDFSEIYYTAENIILTLNPNIKSINDLKNLTVGVQLGSIQDKIAQDYLKDSEIKTLLRIPELILELLSKKVDALLIETPVALQYQKRNPELLIVNDPTLNSKIQGSAIGIKKGNENLVTEINKTITRLIKDNKINEFFNSSLELAEKLNN